MNAAKLPTPKFRRNYKACLNCRLRKVKCDLGPVDNPRDGKCLRCLRERKDCVFVQSKRGSGSGSSTFEEARHSENDFHVARMATSSASSSSSSLNKNFNQPGAGDNVLPGGMGSKSGSNSATNMIHSGSNGSGNNLPTAQPKPNNKEETSGTSGHFSTMEGALVFLAKAAGTIAKADERDNIDAQKKHEQIEASFSHAKSVNESGSIGDESPTHVPNQTSTSSGIPANLNARYGEQLGGSDNSGNDHNRNYNSSRYSEKPYSSHSKQIPKNKRRTVPLADKPDMIRPKGSTKLSTFDYIGAPNGILSEEEAENLIHLFFTTMHPYFPFIPDFLHEPKVLAGYPILLCSILTIASRYHPFPNSSNTGGVPRNIEVHDRLWLYVQRLISQTVWAEASTRSIGTVFAFLLFTEWNPRAIHWRWSDYANKAEDVENSSTNLDGGIMSGIPAGSGATSGGNGDGENNFAGIGAMRRSYRMAWMLIGSAVRLAQDMGFMEVSPKTFLATHIAEINSVMNISRRSMLAHSLSELDLDDDDDDSDQEEEYDLASNSLQEGGSFFEEDENGADGEHEGKSKRKRSHVQSRFNDDMDHEHILINMSEEELRQLSLSPSPIKFTSMQKAKIELLQIMSLGHESLYGYKAQLGSLTQRQNLSVLNILSPILKNWQRKYSKFLIVTKPKPITLSSLHQHLLNQNSRVAKELSDIIDRESLIFEFNYTKLYIYSLALSPSPQPGRKRRHGDNSSSSENGNNFEDNENGNGSKRRNKVSLKLDEISKAAVFIEQAFTAANEMLQSAQRIHKLKMLSYMPVRWLTRIVRAIAFVVKCYLTITAHNKTTGGNTAANASIANSFDGFDSTVLSLSLISIEEIMLTIQRAAITLRDCSPDELHLCTRYSNVLMYLCSEMKSKSKNHTEGDDYLHPSKRSRLDTYEKLQGRYQQNSDQAQEQQVPHQQSQQQFSKAPVQPPSLQGMNPNIPNRQPYSGNQQFYNVDEGVKSAQTNQSEKNANDIGVAGASNSPSFSPAVVSAVPAVPQPDLSSVNYGSGYFQKGLRSENITPGEDASPFHTMGDSEVMEWFMNNRDVGLDFVGPWTEMIEQQLDSRSFNFDDALQ